MALTDASVDVHSAQRPVYVAAISILSMQSAMEWIIGVTVMGAVDHHNFIRRTQRMQEPA